MQLTQHCRVQTVSIGKQDWRRQDNEQDMGKEEIGTPERHLHNLDNELPSRLRQRRVSKATTIPFTRPPGSVRFIVLELTRKEDSDKELVNGALDGHNAKYA